MTAETPLVLPPAVPTSTTHLRDAQWQELVTEGHVLAARVRARAPRIVAYAGLVVGLAAVGMMLSMTSFTSFQTGASRVVDDRPAQISKARDRVAAAVNSWPAFSGSEQARKNLDAGEVVTQVIEPVRQYLAGNPAALKSITVKELSPDQWWRGAWDHDALNLLRGKEAVLLGLWYADAFGQGNRAWFIFRQNPKTGAWSAFHPYYQDIHGQTQSLNLDAVAPALASDIPTKGKE